jgi:hypothetical protein
VGGSHQSAAGGVIEAMARRWWQLILMPGVLSCSPRGAAPPAVLRGGVHRGLATLAVVPSAGVRLNARLPPTLELLDGRLLQVTNGITTADSAYFAEPPWTVRPDDLSGTTRLRVSYCRTDESVCRTATWSVRTPKPDQRKAARSPD